MGVSGTDVEYAGSRDLYRYRTVWCRKQEAHWAGWSQWHGRVGSEGYLGSR